MSVNQASPYKLKLFHTFKADNATAAEEALHRLLHLQRLEGEWFKLTPEQKNIIVSIKAFEKRQFWVKDSGVDEDKLFGI